MCACWPCLLVAFRIYRLVCTHTESECHCNLQTPNNHSSSSASLVISIIHPGEGGHPVTQLGWTWRSPTHQIILFFSLSVCFPIFFFQMKISAGHVAGLPLCTGATKQQQQQQQRRRPAVLFGVRVSHVDILVARRS